MKVESLKQIDSDEGTSFHFRESVRLLRELHFLMAEGKSETDEADRVRDLMDVHWYRMSPDEIRRVEGLSADLYTLVDPPPPPQQADPSVVDETSRLIEAAWNKQDWDTLLELLRDRPHPYSPNRVAFLRATCWEKLGDLETSLLFLKKAVSRSPSKGRDVVIKQMSSLMEVGRSTEAIALADRTLSTTERLDPDPLYMTAGAPMGSIQVPGDGGQK